MKISPNLQTLEEAQRVVRDINYTKYRIKNKYHLRCSIRSLPECYAGKKVRVIIVEGGE